MVRLEETEQLSKETAGFYFNSYMVRLEVVDKPQKYPDYQYYLLH